MSQMVMIEVDGQQITRRSFIQAKAAEGLSCPEIGKLLRELGCETNSATIHQIAADAAFKNGFELKRANKSKPGLKLHVTPEQLAALKVLIDKHGKKEASLTALTDQITNLLNGANKPAESEPTASGEE